MPKRKGKYTTKDLQRMRSEVRRKSMAQAAKNRARKRKPSTPRPVRTVGTRG